MVAGFEMSDGHYQQDFPREEVMGVVVEGGIRRRVVLTIQIFCNSKNIFQKTWTPIKIKSGITCLHIKHAVK